MPGLRPRRVPSLENLNQLGPAMRLLYQGVVDNRIDVADVATRGAPEITGINAKGFHTLRHGDQVHPTMIAVDEHVGYVSAEQEGGEDNNDSDTCEHSRFSL